MTFYEWWQTEKYNVPLNPEYEDMEEIAECGWLAGYKEALRQHGLLGGKCNDLLDHYRIPGTNKCCKCGFKFE